MKIGSIFRKKIRCKQAAMKTKLAELLIYLDARMQQILLDKHLTNTVIPKPYLYGIKELVLALTVVRLSSYGFTWEFGEH